VAASWVLVSSWRGQSYVSTARILVNPSRGGTSQSQQTLATERLLIASPDVVAAAARSLGLNERHNDLAGGLSVSVPVDTQVVQIAYSAGSSRESQRRAAAFANAYLSYSNEITNRFLSGMTSLQNQINDLRQQAELSQLGAQQAKDSARAATLNAKANSLKSTAETLQQRLSTLVTAAPVGTATIVNTASLGEPTARSGLINFLIGLLLGAILGVIAAFAVDYMDPRVRERADLEARLGIPVLALVGGHRNARGLVARGRWAQQSAAVGPEAEREFRRIAAEVTTEYGDSGPGVLAVTMVGEQAARMTTTLGLASALARIGQSVMIVVADMRDEDLQRTLAVTSEAGLRDVLAERAAVAEAVQATQVTRLSMMTAGNSVTGDSGPTSARIASAIAAMKELVDLVLIAAPEVSDPDLIFLAKEAGGVVVAVDMRRATRRSISQARESLGRLPARVLGAVMVEVDGAVIDTSSAPAQDAAEEKPPEQQPTEQGRKGEDNGHALDRIETRASRSQRKLTTRASRSIGGAT
jgi:succinoglycan biosynthesis transport protein ExoP